MKVNFQKKSAARARPGLMSLFAGVVCFFALVQLLCIVAGVTRITFDRPVALSILGLSLWFSVLFATRFFEPAGADNKQTSPGGIGTRLVRTALSLAGIGVIGWSVWVWVQLWDLAWLRPPYDWDGLYYHIPAMHEWVMSGRVSFVGFMPYVPYVNFPMGVELFSFFAYYVLDTDRLVNGCNLWYWPLAFISLVVIASRLGARGVWRWVAGALIVGVPVFVCQSVSCYIDPGFASTVMASIAAACVFVFDRKYSAWWKATLLGAAVGLMAGSKGTGLPFAVVLVAVALTGVFLVHRFDRWKHRLSTVGVVLAVALAVGGYWYVRNAALTGNPIYPIQLKFGEKIIIEGADHDEFNNANLPPWLENRPAWQRLFVSWTQPDAPVSGYAPVGGMGYIWLAGGVPAILLLWVQFRRRRSQVPFNELFFLSVLTLVMLAVQPAAWWARFTIWMHALGLSCLAAAVYYAVNGLGRNRWHIVTIVLALCIFGVAVWESSVTLDLERQDGRNTDLAKAEYVSSLEYILPGILETPHIDEFFKAKKIARGPWNSDYGTLLGGVLALPIKEREITVLPVDLREQDIMDLRDRGVEWIVWDMASAGEIPETIRSYAKAEGIFNPAEDVHFRFVRLQ